MKLIRFAAGLSVALTIGALSAVGAATMTTPTIAHASSVGEKISRTEVIDRAKYWYNRGDTWYSQKQSDAISDGTAGSGPSRMDNAHLDHRRRSRRTTVGAV